MSAHQNNFLYVMGLAEAYAMAWEFVKNYADVEGPNDLSKFYAHPEIKNYPASHYTDDTQMTIANAELLLKYRDNLEDLTTEIFANAYVTQFKKNPRHGYSKHMYKTLNDKNVQNGQQFMNCLHVHKGITGGAAMRAAPFGLVPDINLAMSLVEKQSKVTHDTEEGIVSAQIVATRTHLFHYDLKGLPTGAPSLVSAFDLRTPERLADPQSGIGIVSDAMSCVLKNKTFSELLKNIVELGNKNGLEKDTDTIAAIAMSVASRSKDFIQNIPEALEKTFESGAYDNKSFGADYLKDLDNRLLAAFPAKHQL